MKCERPHIHPGFTEFNHDPLVTLHTHKQGKVTERLMSPQLLWLEESLTYRNNLILDLRELALITKVSEIFNKQLCVLKARLGSLPPDLHEAIEVSEDLKTRDTVPLQIFKDFSPFSRGSSHLWSPW